MLPQFLCAALALAAPAGEIHDIPPVVMRMEIYPERPMLGDIVIVKITAINRGKEAVPLPKEEFESLYGEILIQIGGLRPYRYFLPGGGVHISGSSPMVPLSPGEKRLVHFGPLGLPPIRDIRRDFWAELVKENRSLLIDAYLSCLECERRYRASESFEKIRPRPPEEVETLLEAYSQERSKNFDGWGGLCTFGTSLPKHFATLEEMAALEAKLSDGTLRDALRATRLVRVVSVEKAHPRGDAQRRAAAKELLALVDESEELERQYLAYKIFKWFYGRSIKPDQIEREFVEAVVRRAPEILVKRSIGHGPGGAIYWPALTRRLKAKAADANEQTRVRQ